MPSRRPCDEAIDVASIAQQSLPQPIISRNSRCRSIASGVFSVGVRVSSPIRRSMLLSSAGRRPKDRRHELLVEGVAGAGKAADDAAALALAVVLGLTGRVERARSGLMSLIEESTVP